MALDISCQLCALGWWASRAFQSPSTSYDGRPNNKSEEFSPSHSIDLSCERKGDWLVMKRRRLACLGTFRDPLDMFCTVKFHTAGLQKLAKEWAVWLGKPGLLVGFYKSKKRSRRYCVVYDGGGGQCTESLIRNNTGLHTIASSLTRPRGGPWHLVSRWDFHRRL